MLDDRLEGARVEFAPGEAQGSGVVQAAHSISGDSARAPRQSLYYSISSADHTGDTAAALSSFWRTLHADSGSSSDGAQAPIEAKLLAMLEHARASYPALELEDRDYFSYLAERFTGADVLDYLERVDGPELYLARACASADPRALRSFEQAYFGEIRVGASRLRCTPEELDEITQRVRLALFKLADDGRVALLSKTARGDLRALIRLIALRAGLSLRRGRGPGSDSHEQLLELGNEGDGLDWMVIKDEHRAKFRVALAAAIEGLEPKQRTLLRLHEVDGLGLAAIARMYQVDRSTITRRLARARATIFAETRRELAERHGIPRQHFESFIDVIRSNFAASIHRALGE